ncbi:MAG: peptidylprolyl isomerase [Microbacteriaceae bacterium]|nr:peptidylprolyl isomerase [Microbacteriaceae bacterium]
MRKTTAVLAAIALLAGLSACSSSDTVPGCTPLVKTGDVAKTVKVTGGKGATAPKVTFPTPLYTKTTEKTTISDGTGKAIQTGQPTLIDVTVLNGTDGSVLTKTTYSKQGNALISAGTAPSGLTRPLTEALVCAQVGSRFAVVGSPKDSHGGKADATNGIGKNDSFVYVVNVRQAFLAKANGGSPAPVNGLPTVVTTKNGTPGLVFPGSPAPKTAVTSVTQSGSGKVVTKKSAVIANITGVTWAAKPSAFTNTWSTKQPNVLVFDGQTISPGLSKAIIGKRVGSQVLVVLPAKAATVPAPSDSSGIAAPPAGATVVYVVDILGIVKE